MTRSFWVSTNSRTSRHSVHAQGKLDWLRIRNEFSTHAQKIGPSQRRFLVMTKRSAGSGDQNGTSGECFGYYPLTKVSSNVIILTLPHLNPSEFNKQKQVTLKHHGLPVPYACAQPYHVASVVPFSTNFGTNAYFKPFCKKE